MDKVNQILHDDEVIVCHNQTKGIYLQSDGQSKEFRLCWCEIPHLMRSRDLLVETYTEEDQREDPLQCYYFAKLPEEVPINRLASRAFNKIIRGPVFLRYRDNEADRRKILNFLLSQ